MQKEEYLQADIDDEPAPFENKPIHPLRKLAENPWAVNQDKTNTAGDESWECINE